LRLGAVLGSGLAARGEEPRSLGTPLSAYGERSPFVKPVRTMRQTKTPEAGSSATPLADTYGIITPSSLHYERHHAGVPNIDPARHRLVIHGMVERPLILTMDDIRRLPSVSRIHFLECGGNSGGEWQAKNQPDVQRSYGLASCSEWTGVPLRLLLEEAGVKAGAKWLIAEGADACKMQRSVPLAPELDYALLAYGQNGEPLRPSQGFPLRLLTPGWEGNVQVKWLQRLLVTDQPHMTRDETSKYSDLMPDGKARIFSLPLEAKSVVTFPSGGQTLPGPGLYEVTGLAWTGKGLVTRVELTFDGGASWVEARMDEPRFPRAFVRFRMPWRWDGKPVVMASRATDETGYVQPTREQLVAARGMNSGYHFNGIKLWRVGADGVVTNVEGA